MLYIDVTYKIKTEEISYHSTKWAIIPYIKEYVRNIQKNFLTNNDTVIEGRDICTRIAPNADYKFYLYFDFETRVNRLYELQKNISIDEIRNELIKRDDLDINQGNFVKPENAIEIDTTNMSLDMVYKKIIEHIK